VSALVALAPFARAQKVWVVAPAPGPGVDTTSLSVATTVAAEGDIVLVRPGVYDSFSVVSKSLTVAADTGGAVTVANDVYVLNLTAQQRVSLRGLKIHTPFAITPSERCALTLDSCAGPVLVEDCEIFSSYTNNESGSPGLRASNCASVAFTRCSVRGAKGFPGPLGGNASRGGWGVLDDASTMFLFDTDSTGGEGGDMSIGNAGDGGGGVALSGGANLFASGSAIQGGLGGSYTSLGSAGDGGIGLLCWTPSRADLLETTIAGGPGGPLASPGMPGPTFVGDAPPTILSGVARHFVASSPVRELQLVTLGASGIPSEHAGALVSLDPQVGVWPYLFGAPLLLSLANASVIDVGTCDPTGAVSVSLLAPALDPHVKGVVVQLQGFFFDVPVSYVQLGPVSSLLLLDSAF